MSVSPRSPIRTAESLWRRTISVTVQEVRSEINAPQPNILIRGKKASLQSLGIIARSPSPLPLEDRPVEELTREELMEVVRMHKVCLKFTIY